MGISLEDFSRMARERPRLRYTSLMGLLWRPEGLRASFDRQPERKAVGVDGIRKADYAIGIEDRLTDLSARLRRRGYRPQPARRTYIPKADGGRRPLGIPSFEDRIVQDRLSGILNAIWEPEFRPCSFGFRPGLSAHAALRRIAEVVTVNGTQWVVEADIKGFFNNVCHDHLMRFLRHRIIDPVFLDTVQRFLKAGVLEDGQFSASTAGTPQGGLVSPVLSNIYLHYVLDWWFEGNYAKTCRGGNDGAQLIRYADDFVACFGNEADARRFMTTLVDRLATFGLEVEPRKTCLLRFGREAWLRGKCGGPRPQTFSFLGITHYVGTSRRGTFVVGRKTDGKRASKKLKILSDRLQKMRTQGGKAMLAYTRRHLQGHINYYGVSGNSKGVSTYCYQAGKLLFKWLNRRSQRKSLTWARWNELLATGLLPRARIVHNLYPDLLR